MKYLAGVSKKMAHPLLLWLYRYFLFPIILSFPTDVSCYNKWRSQNVRMPFEKHSDAFQTAVITLCFKIITLHPYISEFLPHKRLPGKKNYVRWEQNQSPTLSALSFFLILDPRTFAGRDLRKSGIPKLCGNRFVKKMGATDVRGYRCFTNGKKLLLDVGVPSHSICKTEANLRCCVMLHQPCPSCFVLRRLVRHLIVRVASVD